MRCEDIQRVILESGQKATSGIQNHLANCGVCAAYLQDYQLVQSGFRIMAEELPPEPTFGFAQRLVRRLQDLSESTWSRENFWELAGRRAVYATLVLTFLAVLAAVLPSHSQGRVADMYPVEPVIMADETDPLLSDDSTSTFRPTRTGEPAQVESGQK